MTVTECYEVDYDRADVQVLVDWYPVDGFRCRVEVWSPDDGRWLCGYDKRVIADSFWEGLCGVLCETLEWDGEQADWQLAKWGIFQPDDEEEN